MGTFIIGAWNEFRHYVLATVLIFFCYVGNGTVNKIRLYVLAILPKL